MEKAVGLSLKTGQTEIDVYSGSKVASEEEPAMVSAEAAAVATYTYGEATYGAMLSSIRSWAFWCLGLGAIHLVGLTGWIPLSGSWGIVLILLGIASFYVRQPAMFVVYAGVLLWAAISNLMTGSPAWMVGAVVQLYWAYRAYRHFPEYRSVLSSKAFQTSEAAAALAKGGRRASAAFPWIGASLSCLSLVGFFVVLVGAVIWGVMTGLQGNGWDPSAEVPSLLEFLASVALNIGALGVATSLAALLSGYRPKVVAVAGTLLGSLVLVSNIVIVFLGRA